MPSRSTYFGDAFGTEGLQKGCNTIAEIADVRKEEVVDFKSTHLNVETDAVVPTTMYSDVPVDYVVTFHFCPSVVSL